MTTWTVGISRPLVVFEMEKIVSKSPCRRRRLVRISTYFHAILPGCHICCDEDFVDTGLELC